MQIKTEFIECLWMPQTPRKQIHSQSCQGTMSLKELNQYLNILHVKIPYRKDGVVQQMDLAYNQLRI